jgi:hypothetical protein
LHGRTVTRLASEQTTEIHVVIPSCSQRPRDPALRADPNSTVGAANSIEA